MPLGNELTLTKNSIPIKIKYMNFNFVVIQVPLAIGLTWYSVAEEAKKLFSLSMNKIECENFLRLHIRSILSPNREKFDLSQRILYYDIRNLATGIFTLLMEGSYHKLNEYGQLKIFEYLNNKKDLISLMKVSKRFKSLFSSDKIWKLIPFDCTVWLGKGKCYGNEENEWDVTKDKSGLSILNLYRLRWMSHNTSRLRLFYGNIDEIQIPISTYLFDPYISIESYIKNFIFIFNCTDCLDINKMFMTQLHYVIPETATAYHLNKNCKLLFKNGKLINIESSPTSSRSRKHCKDPGTRVESINDCFYRRIGDSRLTFISLDNNPKNCSFYENFEDYIHKSIGNIVLIEYDSFNLSTTYNKLENIWNKLNEKTKYKNQFHKNSPILIYLLIDWKPWVPINTDMNEFENSISYKNGIFNITNDVYNMLNKIIYLYDKKYYINHTTNCHQSRNWYIQPIDQTKFMTTLKHGYFSGLNWFLRTCDVNNEVIIQNHNDL